MTKIFSSYLPLASVMVLWCWYKQMHLISRKPPKLFLHLRILNVKVVRHLEKLLHSLMRWINPRYNITDLLYLYHLLNKQFVERGHWTRRIVFQNVLISILSYQVTVTMKWYRFKYAKSGKSSSMDSNDRLHTSLRIIFFLRDIYHVESWMVLLTLGRTW